MNDSADIQALAAKIELLILDVDGVLTDGRIYLDAEGREMKVFHARDGHGIKLARQAGIEIAVISGRETPLVVKRMNALGVTRIQQKIDDKAVAYAALMDELGLDSNQVAYLGDDTIDLPVMTRVALPMAVADAHPEVIAAASYVTALNGGLGAVREVCDLLVQAQKPQTSP